MKKLSRVAGCIELSLTRKLFNLAKQYDDVIDFTLGDPDIQTPIEIKEAGCKAIMDGKTRYSQNAGLLDLRKSISSYYEIKESLFYNPEGEIMVTVGAMEGLYLVLLALVDTGDEIIIPAPYYVNYRQMVMMCGGTPVIAEDPENPLVCSIDKIKAAVTKKTKAIVINTPCNPTGKYLDEKFLEEISQIAIEHDLYVITDEVYKCLVYDSEKRLRSIASLPRMKERTIYINSLSKEFCMTGWRLGYVMSNTEVIGAITKLQENIAACAPLPSQYAAIEALRTDKSYSEEMASIFKNRRDALAEEFGKIGEVFCITPPATFYAMVDISKTGMGSEEFAYGLLKAQHVAVVPGKTYGHLCDRYIRIAFTIEESLIREGIRRIGQYVGNLK